MLGHKADPVQVSIDVRCAKDELGKRLFAASECLQTQQIRSFFSRLAAAQRNKVQSPADLIKDEVRDLESDKSCVKVSSLRSQRSTLFVMNASTCVN